MKRRYIKRPKLTWNSGGEYSSLLHKGLDLTIQHHARAAWRDCLNDLFPLLNRNKRTGDIRLTLFTDHGERAFSLLAEFKKHIEQYDGFSDQPDAIRDVRAFAKRLTQLANRYEETNPS